MAVPSDATYLVERDLFEAVRLGSQHLLWQLHTKYLLNPVIPIQDGMAIADIAAGTGIWATEVAPHLPPSARVTAFDNAQQVPQPGGYLQWEDARMLDRVVRGDAAIEVSHMLSRLTSATSIDFRWLEELDQSVKRAEPNLEVVECQHRPWSAELVPLCFQT
ncbi:hypothetical protein N7493_002019 [Penicillium malachiteum]|uniref:Methyltransferase domain-containing protein n=1 Tax=Penicillium malachiteum TaxID=1324776 RepID=A0AAD6HVW2_9EURO|nr:hypothetical protein N7493_002019 [Penicillium malachiteum]